MWGGNVVDEGNMPSVHSYKYALERAETGAEFLRWPYNASCQKLEMKRRKEMSMSPCDGSNLH